MEIIAESHRSDVKRKTETSFGALLRGS